MVGPKISYHLLPLDDNRANHDEKLSQHPTLRSGRTTHLLIVSLVISLMLNTYQYVESSNNAGSCLSQYAGLANDAPTEYYVHTDYRSTNATLADPLWDALPVSPIVVALDSAFSSKHGLEKSIPFPWNLDKGLYHLKAFHHLHCLKNVRRAYLDALNPSSNPLAGRYVIPEEHILHCLDTLRQDVTCNADDTPMPTVPSPHKIGNGQTRQCRSLDRLLEWSQAPERHACFRMLSEYRAVPNSLEEFQFCLQGSNDDRKARDWFGKNGHRDPFKLIEGKVDGYINDAGEWVRFRY